ncbi:MAG: sugar phosphate nucleotidyltransferase [bacterium]
MNKNSPVLLILAAGAGSRYGGLKQLDGYGPNGETIMDYSVFDAIRSGFRKAVFVIQREHLDLFETRIVPKFRSKIEIGYAFQNIHDLPAGLPSPVKREKPWGTGHAVLSARKEISQPFAVINADDFYGQGAFQTMADELQKLDPQSSNFFLMGYQVSNTLSEHGYVSRGLCGSQNGFLTEIKELTKITKVGDRIHYREESADQSLDPDAIVSMNFWGFTPRMFEFIEQGFKRFIRENFNNPEAEYFITRPVDEAIKNKLANVQLLATSEKWLGVTYIEDKAAVVQGIRDRIEKGLYPEALALEWN